jgi:hypothetical protein
MSLEGTIAAVVMLIIGIGWLALPILRRKRAASADDLARAKAREILLTTYERTLNALRDVDEDHLTGKLAQTDYETERAYWTNQGVTVLQALEQAGGKLPKQRKPAAAAAAAAAEAPDADAQLDEAIEKTIANYIRSTTH